MTDQEYMEFALTLARAAMGRTNPNPMVGAVLVKDHRIVGFGAHLRAGTPHAEVHAIRMAGEEAKGSTLYVTLEPCSHYGRTPPCADLVIQSGIRNVYVAMEDPNPLVAGRGIQKLREAGIPVEVGLCEEQARKLNEVFVKWIQTDLPFIAIKTAATLDGKTASCTGDSKWITGPKARRFVHQLRDQYDAIMVGVGTVLHDDPQLTVRLPEGGIHPHRIVVDPALRTARSERHLHVLDTQIAPTTFFCSQQVAGSPEAERLLARGCTLIHLPERFSGNGLLNELDLAFGLRELRRRFEIASILVEGGATLNGSLLDQELVDKVYLFFAPKILGGVKAPGMFGGRGISAVANAWCIKELEILRFDEDLCLVGTIQTSPLEEMTCLQES
jgi:diaminohydroxyphosphoribosylaminopyrimidine deaminase/5-amino-6-(5-phosphoribosylamino)uracil reductase